MTVPMIELDHVSKRYQVDQQIVPSLEGVSFQIERGEFVSIMGPSGSGKSTLLQILGALDSPTEGAYRLEGQDIARLSDQALSQIRNRHFGFVFQAYNLIPDMTALENIELPLTYAGVRQRERRSRAQSRLAAVGLEDRARHFPNQLSGGEQQRVAIARALVTDPTLLLADEPTGNLSSEGGEVILGLLREMNDDGVTIVLVTHDTHVGAQAKRTLWLTDGQVVSDRQTAGYA